MRTASCLAWIGLAALLAAGCAGPERKLGRGLRNVTEFARMGELRRSVEQTALWDGAYESYTTGFIRGFNRSVARTAIGAFEVATFPIPTPTYDPFYTSTNRLYPDASVRTRNRNWGGLVLTEPVPFPDSYKPNLISDGTFDTDSKLGFSGGDVAPFIPGSRFHIFDN